jgi:hypothetical protein
MGFGRFCQKGYQEYNDQQTGYNQQDDPEQL